MKEKGLQGKEKDLLDAEIMSILTTVKTQNPYLTVLITILKVVLKMHFIIYAYHIRILSYTAKFDNKALELIQLSQIFNLLEAVFQLPDKF